MENKLTNFTKYDLEEEITDKLSNNKKLVKLNSII